MSPPPDARSPPVDARPGHADAAAGPSSSSSSSSPSRPESCVKYFDALWFCYSPGHQLRQYYRYGNVDDCATTWASLWACLGKRTRFGDAAAAVEQTEHPLWRLRSPEEARVAWEAEFGACPDDDKGTGQH